LSVEKTAGGDSNGQITESRLDRSAVVALASDIRTCLQLHQQLGVEQYPLTPGSQKFLAGKGENLTFASPLKQEPQPLSSPRSAIPQPIPPPVCTAATSGQLASLRRAIEGCCLCDLVSGRQGQVFGVGTVAARLLIIGDYSNQGDEFSETTLFGTAEDAMLWNMMRAIGLAPEEVYVTNTVKCCPQAARQPEKESEQRCLAHLRREIELIGPRIICAMGEAAARSVLGGGSESVLRLRGRFHRYGYGGEAGDRIQIMVTFHPRFLLGCEDMKKAAWKDLQMIQRQLQVR
jgi:uracil-DNA glycosylase family 4